MHKIKQIDATPEVPVQEQPKVKIKITNLNELNKLISDLNITIKKIKNFKIKIEIIK